VRWLALALAVLVVGCGEDEETGTTPPAERP
jgi:hypothetical protein